LPKYIEVEWTFGPVKEYKLLDPASSLHNIHRGAQIPTGHFVQLLMNNILLDKTNFYLTLSHV